MSEYRFAPIAEVLPGIDLLTLPDGYVPLDLVVSVKCVDSDGDVCWIQRYTKNIHTVEALGALRAHVALCERDVLAMYETAQEGDDAS